MHHARADCKIGGRGDSFGQIFITDTNREHLDRILYKVGSDYKMFRVEQGEISEMKDREV